MQLRRINENDLEQRVKWMNNPKVYKSMHFAIPVLLDKTILWYKNNLKRKDRVDLIFHNDEGETVAFGGITSIDTALCKGELYVFVNPDIQKKGIGTVATRLLCDYGFQILKLNKIYLEINEDNVVAQRVYEKCGFRLEGRLNQGYLTADGELKNLLYYGLLKDDWGK